MNKNRQSRSVASKKVRDFLAELADEIMQAQDRVTVALSGNTFSIHLEAASINITVNESPKGGAK